MTHNNPLVNEAKEKYEEKFHCEGESRKLSSWRAIAQSQIQRFYNDDDFYHYVSTQVMRNAENPPGPFTRFLYWFALSCQAGWGVMVDFSERSQQIYLCDKYYKWMHKLRDELNEVENESPDLL